MAFAGDSSPAIVSVVVPFPAGGPADWIARELAPGLQRALGSQVVVENVPGASGALGVGRVLGGPRDGAHLLIGSPSEVIVAPEVNLALQYRAEQLRLLGVSAVAPLVLIARPDLPFATVRDLLKHARDTRERELNYGSYGVGSIAHVVAEAFRRQTGARLVHVPYTGAPPMLQDLMGGQIDLAFLPLAGNLLDLVAAGRVRALAVAAPREAPQLKGVPVLDAAAGLQGFDYELWSGLLVPADTPEPLCRRLNAAMRATLSDEALRERVAAAGTTLASPMSLEEAQQFFTQEIARYRAVARDLRIKPAR
ncbi:MAG TPA: tripartite tricarboxylate transporter substrate binding protein [Burkholderiaceae bacterium]|jgi:tripartite-type tricarboxylate transporter receptor subunit TctC|nr:tripartite tricarboxylate transporter substrate binding protein [Burkholderiaceae bacterium]